MRMDQQRVHSKLLSILLLSLPCFAEDSAPSIRFFLPFPEGKSYRCVVGNDQEPGHKDEWNKYAFDFMMPDGTEICASADGEVVGAKEDASGPTGNASDNNFVEIRHADGTLTAYHHLKKDGALVSVGDRVFSGDVIGLSGRTGAASGPHLHFTRQDPNQMKHGLPLRFEEVEGGIPQANWMCLSKNVRVRALPAIKAAAEFLRVKAIALPFRCVAEVAAAHAAVERAKDPGVPSWEGLQVEVQAAWKDVEDLATADLEKIGLGDDVAARARAGYIAREHYARTPWEGAVKKALGMVAKDPVAKDADKDAKTLLDAWRQVAAAVREDLAGRAGKARGMYDAYLKKADEGGPWVPEVTARLEILATK